MGNFTKWFLISWSLIFLIESGFAYDDVSVQRIIPLIDRKSDIGVARSNSKGELWILNHSKQAIERISFEGTVTASVRAGSSKSSLFRKPVDFCFSKGGLLIVADGAGQIVILEGGNKEG